MTLMPCGLSLARTSPLRRSGESSFSHLPYIRLASVNLFTGRQVITNHEVPSNFVHDYYGSMTDGLALLVSHHIFCGTSWMDQINMGPWLGFCTSCPIHDHHVVPCVIPCSHSLLHCCSSDEQLSGFTILLPMSPK